MTVKQLELENLRPALKLVTETFSRFEAPDYSEEGIRTFMDFISYKNMTEKYLSGEMRFFYCYEASEIIGVIAYRKPSHISLLFVDDKNHYKGIGRKLFEFILSDCNSDLDNITEITVNSSPYAVDFYKKLNFVPTDTEKCEDGIRYTPMKYLIKEK